MTGDGSIPIAAFVDEHPAATVDTLSDDGVCHPEFMNH
jgi:hypothetical protein